MVGSEIVYPSMVRISFCFRRFVNHRGSMCGSGSSSFLSDWRMIAYSHHARYCSMQAVHWCCVLRYHGAPMMRKVWLCNTCEWLMRESGDRSDACASRFCASSPIALHEHRSGASGACQISADRLILVNGDRDKWTSVRSVLPPPSA